MCPRSHKPLTADLDPELRTPGSQFSARSTPMHLPTGLGEIKMHSKIFTPLWDKSTTYLGLGHMTFFGLRIGADPLQAGVGMCLRGWSPLCPNPPYQMRKPCLGVPVASLKTPNRDQNLGFPSVILTLPPVGASTNLRRAEGSLEEDICPMV